MCLLLSCFYSSLADMDFFRILVLREGYYYDSFNALQGLKRLSVLEKFMSIFF